MAVQTPNQGQGGQSPAAAPSTAMAGAMSKAGVAPAGTPGAGAPGSAPAHPNQNVGSGRNPGMNNIPTGQAQSPGFSFRQIGAGMRTMMSRNPASETLSKLTKALGDLYAEAAQTDFEYTLLPIDMNQTPNLSVSVLVVAVRDKQKLELGVAFQTLLVEASAEAPAPRFESIGGNVNVEVMRTIAEAYDRVMIETVSDRVARQFPNMPMFNAEATVVPRDFKIEDKELLYRLAANTAFACSQELQTKDRDFQDLNLANAAHDSNLQVRTTFGNPQISDAVGHPLRADVRIDFQAVPLNQNQQQQNLERTQLISSMAGFLDIIWDPMQPQPGQFGSGWGQQQQSYQRYAARLVGTQLESSQLLTIPAQLLALVPAVALSEGNAWVQAFKPSPFSGDGKDIRDIGAIGYEVNFENNPTGVGNPVDTKGDSFKPESLHKLVAATFKPGLVISLDVPECGPQTWYNSVFAAAAEATANQDAINAIIRAADILTAGHFARYFPNNGRVAMDENNRIHLGYYTGRDGTRHDIRDIDYLAVLNLMGDKDMGVVKNWSDTFLKVQFPLIQRLAERKRIITGLVGDAVFTGYARRVTFTQEFMSALVAGCKDAGLTMRSATMYSDLNTYERATGSFLGNTVMSSDVTGVFNRGNFGAPAASASGLSPFARKW